MAGTVGGGKSGKLEIDSEESLKFPFWEFWSLLSMNKGRGALMAPSKSTVFFFHISSFSLDEWCPTRGWGRFSSILKDGSVTMSSSVSSGSGGKSIVLGGGAMGGGGGGMSSSEEF